MSQQMYHVGICSICHEGALGIRICGGCEAAVVLCDECDSLWLEPDCAEPPIFLKQPDAPCPNCAASLYQDPSHWADQVEIEQHGWTEFVRGESSATQSDSAVADSDSGDSGESSETSETSESSESSESSDARRCNSDGTT
jgi:hypothetical protein